MQRYNIFNQVHKGLRALLYDTAMQIQQTDFWNAEEASGTLRRIRAMISLFDKHARCEERFIMAAVKNYEPSVADLFQQEHSRSRLLAEYLAGAVKAYEVAPVITGKSLIAPKITGGFNRFIAFSLEHLTKEEEVLNAILWRYYSDEELFNITKQMALSASPIIMAKLNKWMLHGLHTGEIIGWMKNVEAHAPEPVYQSLLATAEKELSEQKFRQMVKGLSETIAIA